MKKAITIIGLSVILIFSHADFAQPVKVHPLWSRNATIYEVNIRQFTPEGTFAAFAKHLNELKKLGVKIIWLMPVHPVGVLHRKGKLGSYYSVKDYKAVNTEFGTKKDFADLVNRAHKLGMKVILDWVANHTSWDNPWIEKYPDFYTRDKEGKIIPPVPDWRDVADLDYSNHLLWEKMSDAMLYWIKNFDIDGFRCDVAEMVPLKFWDFAVSKLMKQKNVFMLAEGSAPELYSAFDMTYDWKLKDIFNAIAKGEKDCTAIYNHFAEYEPEKYPQDSYRMLFTSNHDENSWTGSAIERLGKYAPLFAVVCETADGMPLIYSGQEAGLKKRLRFFDKDTISWKSSPFRALYSKLNKLKFTNRALRNGDGGKMEFITSPDSRNILIYKRKKDNDEVITMINFSNFEKTFWLKDYPKYKDVMSGRIITESKVIIPSFGFRVLEKK